MQRSFEYIFLEFSSNTSNAGNRNVAALKTIQNEKHLSICFSTTNDVFHATRLIDLIHFTKTQTNII